MRQSHQKSRSRGRNRKPQNPMSRNYESNGPDVKIRGNASHIADKYSTLARDALSNGDTVMAENYYQHAEHYNRIVAAAQAQSRTEEQNQNRSDEHNNANGRGPQPEVEETKSDDANAEETKAETSEAANAADANAESIEEKSEKAPRKTGRGRRTRRVADGNGEDAVEAVTAEASDSNGSQVKLQAEEDEKPSIEVEAISDDAAKLPGSITGGVTTEEA
ncbi:MAG: DUF4167 domain-containing protein [Pseudomonadota bacterium]